MKNKPMAKKTLSVAIATYNEASNIQKCLSSVSDFVDEIILVDGQSTDDTVAIAKTFPNVKVIRTENKPNFHINKQMAIESCRGDWILLLDADEVVSPKLQEEIKKILKLTQKEISDYQAKVYQSHPLFTRHQRILEARDGRFGQDSDEYTAFFFPRKNYFLGKFLTYGGVYPDGVIRLFKKSASFQPAKDVHEQIRTTGQVGWLSSDLLHYADPTFSRYLLRNNRYTTNIASGLLEDNVPISFSGFIKYFFFLPIHWFLLTYLRHKAFLDGFPGFVFSWYSSLRFPLSYIKLYELKTTGTQINIKKDWD